MQFQELVLRRLFVRVRGTGSSPILMKVSGKEARRIRGVDTQGNLITTHELVAIAPNARIQEVEESSITGR